MAWTDPRTWTDGELVTGSLLNTHLRDNLNAVDRFISKIADESVTSSTALQDDDHLFFSIGANETWWFRFHLGHTGSPGAFKAALNAPATASGWWGFTVATNAAVSVGRRMTATFVDGETDVSTDGGGDVVEIDGAVTVTAAGTFKLRWAQNSSNATPTTLKKGSTLHIGRVA